MAEKDPLFGRVDNFQTSPRPGGQGRKERCPMARKVLVLEDESSIRGFIVINLTRAGYEVVEAETGEEALEKLREALQENPVSKAAPK